MAICDSQKEQLQGAGCQHRFVPRTMNLQSEEK
jgi:hypothetical protein